MAIGRSKGPAVVAVGELVGVRELPPTKAGEIWAAEATLRTQDGADVFVKFRIPRQEDEAELYSNRVGSVVAMWATAATGPRGDSLWYESPVTADDLDRINSGLSVKA